MTEHPDRNKWLEASDEKFLELCECQAFKSKGPGGQKVNKTSSAVRLVHKDSGLETTCSEGRSQLANRMTAIQKLKMKIAADVRCPSPPTAEVLKLSLSNPAYPLLLALIFDTLHLCEFRISDAAGKLAISTGKLVKLLGRDPVTWQTVNTRRIQLGLPPLKKYPEHLSLLELFMT